MPPSLIIEQFDPLSISLFVKHKITNPSLSKKTPQTGQNICATEVFAPFSQLNWSMLLHSGNCQHENSRFDIIVANPVATITNKNTNNTCVSYAKGKSQQIEQDPLVWIKQAVNEYLPKPISVAQEHRELPFLGGAVGYFGYDLGARYEVLPQVAVDDMNTPILNVGIYDWTIIKDNQQNIWWFVSHRLSLETVLETVMEQTTRTTQSTDFKIKGDWVSNMTKAQYLAKFTQVQEYLKSGDCYQINLAQRFTASYHGDEYQAFKQLLNANQGPFSAFLNFEDYKVISVSPERLLSLKQGVIESKPIKGTIKRLKDEQADQANKKALQHSMKDRAENVMIVDLLRNDIGRVSKTGSVKVPRLFAIESFPAVHHLVSTIKGVLKPQLHGTDLLRAAFPGGSITGAPKVRAMEIIDELEPHRRSIYCGSIGYICCTGNMDTSITIRTLLCKSDKVHAWAGGGIVADSTCDSEYQETYAKVCKILPVLSNLHNTDT